MKTLYTFSFGQKWLKSVFYLFFFCKIKCPRSSYHLSCTCVSSKRKTENEIFMCDFILFLKNKVRAILS